jgi:hypothetical protein
MTDYDAADMGGLPQHIQDLLRALETHTEDCQSRGQMARRAEFDLLDEFMDSLTVRQLYIFRRMLGHIINAEDPRAPAQFWDGQSYAMIRHKFDADPQTGLTTAEALTEAMLGEIGGSATP